MSTSSKLPDRSSRLDRIDRRILAGLQRDSTQPVTELAEQVGLSMTPCWRRIQRLEQQGFIKKRVAILDRTTLNAKVTVFIMIKTREHSIEWIDRFHKATRDMTEIVDIYRMSGEVDYLIRAFLPDIQAYDALYKKIISQLPVANMTSMFAMEEIKSTSEVPLDFIPD
ncbi:DNA-binding transcriptional activator DecR [Pseudomonas fluorescens]|uniref:Lrp/AsnC family transcriptional regulator n=1 Tax=unclassified Pseudomonas TaxID=196821 RepID=UPI00124190E7|nr:MULTISPECIES: Lrp/AsnC family transcriptional regulator [unclassified Pseudomonas]VVO07384.1 DNA-binding transcriptional activator DecR [Pseudomonas fluorescens]MCP1463231.1 Lrp/AsnC family transcriptional regulator [Pseudomonas sp. S3E17]MDI3250512.1 Lrp/AsnC family transcriptional regulator [Pseudomonas sp. AL10]MDI3266398.1 Lrp/AsnC family transcriptional regulator [Pseudomonas sp. AL15]VVO70522.1 DNA-binding transcriptional activator DecR [Pseudomonas fluorescens]